MSLAVIEINDAGIEVGVDGELLTPSPGYSVLDGERLLVGSEAQRNARLLPRWTNNRFWNQLNTDAIAQATSTVRHHADLALEHLESIWKPIAGDVDQVILLVPGYYEHAQLGLLLGIARECGMPVAGVADASLLAASDMADQPTTLLLDVHLHRLTLAKIASGNTLSRTGFTTIMETGIFTLWDRWANIIANLFIQTSRFDPMHEAATEQALFDQLPAWIAENGNSHGSAFELNMGDSNYSVSISVDQLTHACAQVYPQLVQFVRNEADAETTLLLPSRFQGFPGLKDSLGLVPNLEVVELAPGQAVRSAFNHAEHIISGDGAVSHVVNLPIARRPSAPAVKVSAHASHLLLGHQAIAVNRSLPLSADLGDGFRLDNEHPVCTVFERGQELHITTEDPSVRVNGDIADTDLTLNPGDVISIGDHQITVIAVS